MNKITKEEHDRRLELYEAGYTDGEIAAALYIGKQAIWLWRKNHNLPTKFPVNKRRQGRKKSQ